MIVDADGDCATPQTRHASTGSPRATDAPAAAAAAAAVATTATMAVPAAGGGSAVNAPAAKAPEARLPRRIPHATPCRRRRQLVAVRRGIRHAKTVSGRVSMSFWLIVFFSQKKIRTRGCPTAG